ncbi:MAG: hypothetical protein ACI37P_04035, partial [Eggerthellaceae bacterium]
SSLGFPDACESQKKHPGPLMGSPCTNKFSVFFLKMGNDGHTRNFVYRFSLAFFTIHTFLQVMSKLTFVEFMKSIPSVTQHTVFEEFFANSHVRTFWSNL